MKKSILVVAAVVLWSTVAGAALSKEYQNWRRGPEQWLMTSEEQRAWKKVATDADAAAFVDLFWARRDPTLNTERNEFHEEFLARVQTADASFKEKKRRGALTDRGQVYIVLGPPASGMAAGSWNAHERGVNGEGGDHSSGADARGSQFKWTWDLSQARELGLPRLEVTFAETPGTDAIVRDVQHGQFSNGAPLALRKMIVSPDMTAVPDWAAHLGQTAAPAPVARLDGKLGRVVLFADISTLDVAAAADPLATLAPAASFAADGEAAWAVEYCGASNLAAPLRVTTGIRGAGVAASNDVLSELQADPMSAVAGCGVLRGITSLADLKPGAYEFVVSVGLPNGKETLAAKRPFRID